ncbi:hypothetical protein EB796_011612 [Bugula neritina]|uniref:Purple acid phosphatase C-terminal domain-containing protein n=1 Tax=Bugula neritina TaxID=10212 RepID=A0A7J7JWJ8_BUGNE|nr:hypothetical protein EB796_011612 [Bugula neritina]
MFAGHSAFKKIQPFWSAYRTQNYGYSKFHFVNGTHLLVEWVSKERLMHHGSNACQYLHNFFLYSFFFLVYIYY